MAFDENFHYGLVQVYSEQWSPFISEAPEGTGPLGALTREPSYLFSYLMSFPYRFFALFTENQDILIILLRLINVAIFTAGLFAFRTLLTSYVKASSALSNFAILMLTLIPITPFLAAHINYDNLLFLLIPYVLMLTLTCADGLRKNSFPVQPLLILAALCFITSIVKYPFLPIAVAMGIYLMGVMIWRKRGADYSQLFHSISRNFMQMTRVAKIGLIGLVVLGGALFTERHIVNYVTYDSFVPDCAKVIDFDHCSQYGPWIRNHGISQNAPESVEPNLPYYAANWYYDMTYRLFFAINADYYTQRPLLLPFITSHFIAISGVFLSLLMLPRLIRKYKSVTLFLLIIIVYSGTLFIRGYSSYLSTTEFLALNGRYFIPIMLLFLIIIGLAYKELFDMTRWRAVAWKAGFVIISTVLMLQGGGVLTYILRSDSSWHRQDQVVITVNDTTKRLIEPLILYKDTEVPLSN